MRTQLSVLMASLGVLCLGVTLTAHHSFTLEYDSNKRVTLKGVVTKVEWTNPHARFYIDVTDEKGTVSNWNLELASPSALARNGWTSRSLKVGDRVTVEGFGPRATGTYRVNARSVVLADGRSVFSGAAEDGAPAGGR
jgi:hypothetical protein